MIKDQLPWDKMFINAYLVTDLRIDLHTDLLKLGVFARALKPPLLFGLFVVGSNGSSFSR